MNKPLSICFVLGTRPEIIKLAPLINLAQRDTRIDSFVISTSQHRRLIDNLFPLFGISADVDLNIISPNQSLNDISIRALQGISPVLKANTPDLVLVQGDTTSAFIGALAAFHENITVGHVEAGLRSHNRRHPFPEEVNRRMISSLADMHFCPTIQNSTNLIREGVSPETVFITGNTVIDSLQSIGADLPFQRTDLIANPTQSGNRLILVTAHRRENYGRPILQLCEALKDLVSRFDDISVLYPLHYNPNIRGPVLASLKDVERIHVVDPLPYQLFIFAMKEAAVILTDSGGVQEEAVSFGTPVCVFRKVTERTEGISQGNIELVGQEKESMVSMVSKFLMRDQPEQPACQGNPYGDGQASRRIMQAVFHVFSGYPRPEDFLWHAEIPHKESP